VVLLSDNHRSIREISNQYLPNKQSSQRRWVDFPNYLHPKEEISFGTNQNSEQETTVEHYLPFSKQQKSALEEKEARALLAYIPAVFICFTVGLIFGFFLVTPAILNVLLSIGDDLFNTQLTAQNYLSFVINTTIPIAILFEFPVVVAFLTSLGILTPSFLIRNRRYAYFILIIIAVVITPADFVSDIVMSIPLILIYEISIIISKYIYNKRGEK